MTLCWPALGRGGFLDLTSLTVPARPVSCIIKNILRGFNILVFGHFQRILLVMLKILKGYLSYVVGIMNALFLTARSAGLKTASVAQVGSSFDKKEIPEFFYTCTQSQQNW
jgi:hypothetical protein